MAENPGGQRKVTRLEFINSTPFEQGYISYMQAAWNSDVPERSPYVEGSPAYKAWCEGQQRACMNVQDGDDE